MNRRRALRAIGLPVAAAYGSRLSAGAAANRQPLPAVAAERAAVLGPGSSESLLRRLPQRESQAGQFRPEHARRRRRRAAMPSGGSSSSASCARGRCRRQDGRGPTKRDTTALVAHLETSLDRAAAANPDPGRTDTFRRLNRTEYQNAIRDLLDVDIDVATLLPADDSSHGFDNISVGGLSPMLLERYLSAAQKISRLAVGTPVRSAGAETVILPADLTQERSLRRPAVRHAGGHDVRYTFPGRRRIPVRAAAHARSQRADRRAQRAASDGAQHRRRAAAGVRR